MAFLSCSTEENVYRVIGEFVSEACPGCVVVVNEVAPDRRSLVTRRVLGLDDSLWLKAASLVGFDPVGKVSPIAPVHRDDLLSGCLSEVPGGFVELAAMEVPRVIARATAETFGLRGAYSIGITDGSQALGNVQVYTRDHDDQPPRELIETIARMCYSTLAGVKSRRQIAEGSALVESLVGSERLLQLFFDISPDGVVITDPDTSHALHFSDAAHLQLGYTREEFSRLSLGDIEIDASADTIRQRNSDVLNSGRLDFETRHRTKGGDFRHVRVTMQCVRIGERELLHCVWRDVTEIRAATAALARSEEHFRLLAENSSDVVVRLTADGVIGWVSPSLTEALDWSLEDWLQRRFGDFVHLDDGDEFSAAMQSVANGHKIVARFRLRTSRGEYRWVEIHAKAYVDTNGRQDGSTLSFRTVDAEVAFQQELERRARYDGLTGLLNRQETLDRIEGITGELSELERETAVLFCDVDNLKHVNDAHGHASGDELLRTVSMRIRQAIRRSDMVGRIGGDEFLVILTGVRDVDDAARIAESVRTLVASPMVIGDVSIDASVSIGVAMARAHDTVDVLIERADHALLQAKRTGRNQIILIPRCEDQDS